MHGVLCATFLGSLCRSLEAHYFALPCHAKCYLVRYVSHKDSKIPNLCCVWHWLALKHMDVAIEGYICCAPGCACSPPPARTVWIMRRSGERVVLIAPSKYTFPSGESSKVTTLGHRDAHTFELLQITINGWFWNKHLAPLIPILPWATWPTSLPWWPFWPWWSDIGGPHLQTFSQCHP